jgi:hypothetical protein
VKFKSQLDSTRFTYVQEGIIVGLLGAVAKTIFSAFPLLELYGFIGPIIGLAFGLKTYGDIKAEENNRKLITKKAKSDEDEYIDD